MPATAPYSNVSNLTLIYHLKLLVDEWLIDGGADNPVTKYSQRNTKYISIPHCISIYGLTVGGHDFLAGIRKDEHWNALKEGLKGLPLKLARDIIAQFAAKFAAGIVNKAAALFGL